MIARPKISRNEWKMTEIGASKVGNFAPFSCPGSGSTVWDLRFVAAPDGSRRLVSCGADRVLRLWVEGEPHAWTVAASLEAAHGRCVYSCDAVGPDPTTRVASGGGDDRVSVYGLGAGFARLADAPKAHDGDVNSVRWSPADATLLATAGDDALVKIWKFVTA